MLFLVISPSDLINSNPHSLSLDRGSDVFLNAPVGAGKTAAFVIGSVFRTGITVVLEPNTAVIDEQVNRLMLCGIGSVAIHNSLTKHERQDIICFTRGSLLSADVASTNLFTFT